VSVFTADPVVPLIPPVDVPTAEATAVPGVAFGPRSRTRRDRGLKFLLRCDRCGWLTSHLLVHTCGNCGHLLETHYFRRPVFVGRTMRRFIGLLPVDEQRFGYLLDTVPETRLVPQEYKSAHLFLKDETALPTGTTKDRMAVVAVSRMVASGIGEFVVSSTGNSSSAFIYYTGMLDGAIRCHVFGALEAIHRVRFKNVHSEIHAIDGDFVEAGRRAKQFAAARGVYWEGGFFNYARREGLKAAYLEAFEQMNYDVDIVIQTVSSGMGILGAYKGYKELQRLGLMHRRVSFVCVQQDSCMPMVEAFSRGRDKITPELIVGRPRGLAEAVLRGDPSDSYPYIHRLVRESGGTFIAVSQASLVAARSELCALGISGCHASAASYAAAKHLRETNVIRPKDRVLVMITGAQHDVGTHDAP
jgi:threonine synthase